MNLPFLLDLFIAGTMLGWAAWQDVHTYTIPMQSVVWGTVAGLFTSAVFYGGHGVLESAIGGLIGGGLGWILVRFVRLGPGDAYLFLALGVVFGPMPILSIFVCSNVLVLMRFVIPVWKKRKIRIPVAPYILTGTILSLWVHSIVGR